MINNAVLKKGVDFAFNEMPADSMSPEKAQRQKQIMLDKIEKGEIKSPEDIMKIFDQLNQGTEA